MVMLFALLTALIPRLVWLQRLGDWHAPLQRGPMEEVDIARHLAEGRGYASPFWHPGLADAPFPSAHSPPGYPTMLAILLRIGGGTDALWGYRVALLTGLLAAVGAVVLLTWVACIRSGPAAGIICAILGALMPPLVRRSVMLWDTPFLMLGMVLLMVLSEWCIRERQPGRYALTGLLAGAGALLNPILLVYLPGVAAIICLDVKASLHNRLARLMAMSAACGLMLAPWAIRNAVTFDRFFVFRNNFGFEIWLGTHPDCTGTTDSAGLLHPINNPKQLAHLNAIGEDAYMQERKAMALTAIREDPGRFARLTTRRIKLFWLGELDKATFHHRWGALRGTAKAGIQLGLLGLTLAGFWYAYDWRGGVIGATVFVLLPIPYYVSHVCPKYRVPVLVLMTYWAAIGLVSLKALWRSGPTDAAPS